MCLFGAKKQKALNRSLMLAVDPPPEFMDPCLGYKTNRILIFNSVLVKVQNETLILDVCSGCGLSLA